MIRHLLILHALVACSTAVRLDAAPVTFELDTYIATVTGNPFGFDNSVRLENVPATVTYDTSPTDINSSATRGDYPHASGGAFFADILGTEITGSSTPFVQIEDLNPDTFRFIDGPRTVGPAGGTMSVDGVLDPDVLLTIAFTDSSGGAFADDSLPSPLPFAVPPLSQPSPFFFPHTIALSDDNGTLLLQLNDIRMSQSPPGPNNPTVPEPGAIVIWVLLSFLAVVCYQARCGAAGSQRTIFSAKR